MNVFKKIAGLFRRNAPAAQTIPQASLDEAFRAATTERILVLRSLSKMNKDAKQAKMYDLCPCGSGKKFKFCCNGKAVSSAQS